MHRNIQISITVQQQKAIIYQISDAMAYLHSLKPPVFHRDLKSPNILVCDQINYYHNYDKRNSIVYDVLWIHFLLSILQIIKLHGQSGHRNSADERESQ